MGEGGQRLREARRVAVAAEAQATGKAADVAVERTWPWLAQAKHGAEPLRLLTSSIAVLPVVSTPYYGD